MAVYFLGEIKIFGGNFPPLEWAFCNGQILPIAGNDNLFTLIGTTYGGDGQNTFALPDLRGRVPIHAGQGPGLSSHAMGEAQGAESVTIDIHQLAAHTHTPAGSTTGGSDNPANNFWGASSSGKPYATAAPTLAMNNASVPTVVGGNQSHDNMVPFLAVNYIIALAGPYPAP